MKQPVTNGPLSQQAEQMQHGEMQHGQMNMTSADIAPNANTVAGFPQDAYMEGPMMAMDEMVAKPETYGLRPGWSQLPPEKYEDVMSRVRQKQPKQEPMPEMQHHHTGALGAQER